MALVCNVDHSCNVDLKPIPVQSSRLKGPLWEFGWGSEMWIVGLTPDFSRHDERMRDPRQVSRVLKEGAAGQE
jgi:hypothetical protein